MAAFSVARNIELSWIYYLNTQIQASWSGVSVVKSFNESYKNELPVVCIRLRPILHARKEIGATTEWNTYSIIIDIFASSDGMRIDLANFITDQINSGCVYYIHSHSSGDSDVFSRVADGRITLTSFALDTPLDFDEDVDRYDKFRHVIEFDCKKT